MPHLDEGALWVRATMPYTISFEESSKIAPQVRAILRSFPEVTVVASEHGRPDDGTDPDRILQRRVLRRAQALRASGTGPYRTKPELIAAIDKKLAAFPGIIFNYTQPAEDAVDEAETGLKSALAVKVFGPDLEMLEEKGQRDQARARGGAAASTHVTLVQELGQPSLTVDIDRAKIARYGINVADVNGLIEAAVGGAAATQVVQGEKLFDLVVRLEPQFRETPEQIGDILVATPGGQQVPLQGARRHPGRQRRVVHLPRGQLALHRRPVLRRGPGPRERRARTRSAQVAAAGQAAGRDTASSGAASTRSTRRRATAPVRSCR